MSIVSLPERRQAIPATSAGGGASLSGRRFLVVSAPFGPFGAVLARTLRARGAEVRRMLFNAGDELYWRGPGAIRFRDKVQEWPDRLGRLVRGEDPAIPGGVTDIIVFGEGGPYNQAVTRAYRRPWRTTAHFGDRGPQVWVLENGYFRPDWVTLERDGVNASSSLPRHAQAYAEPAPEPLLNRKVGRVLPHHVINISVHHLIQLPGRFLYPNYRAPFTQPPWLQCAGHIRRYFGLQIRGKAASDAERLAARGPFFLACLQREGDAQLLRYSPYPDNTAFLAEVMTSFARHAPADCRLVVKNHPLDAGLVDLPRITEALAVERDLQGRVDFIDGGELAKLCRASRGMVVNNSSAALSALGFGAPVKVLGDAFFDFEGLTDQQGLNSFWSAPHAPDADLFQRFRAHVIARSQVNGNYHEPGAIAPTAEAISLIMASGHGAAWAQAAQVTDLKRRSPSASGRR